MDTTYQGLYRTNGLYRTDGLYGVGIISSESFLYQLDQDILNSLSFDRETPKKFHFFFGVSLFLTAMQNPIWKNTTIIVSSDIESLSDFNFIPVDYNPIYLLKPVINIIPKPMELKKNIPAIEAIVSKNSKNDFMSAYMNLISYVPAKNRQKLKSIIIDYLFKQSSIEDSLLLLKKNLDSSLVTDRFIYQFEQDAPSYKKAIISSIYDNVDPYVISFFRSEYGKDGNSKGRDNNGKTDKTKTK